MSDYNLEENMKNLKKATKEMYETLENINLFTQKLCTLDRASEDKNRFERLDYLDASPYKKFQC